MKTLSLPKYAAIILIALTCGQKLLFAEPGRQAVLNSKTLDVTLYISAIHRNAQKETTATFVWIPSEIEKACLDKEFAHCDAAANCRLFPEEQVCTANSPKPDCKPQARKSCAQFNLRTTKTDKQKTLPPTHLLQVTPSTLPPKVATKVKAWLEKIDFVGTKGLLQVSKKHSVKAKVKWEEQPNGENFQILEFR